jgi:hypothetical protein
VGSVNYCTCDGGHAILCSEHGEEAMRLLRQLAEEEWAQTLEDIADVDERRSR